MATGMSVKDPTAEVVRSMLPNSTATGTILPKTIVRIAYNGTSTADAGMAWVNPEDTSVAAKAYMVFTTAGTGTYDMGVGTAGTGSNDNVVNGGTMTVGVQHRAPDLGTNGSASSGSSSPLGGSSEWFLLGANDATATNSIVAKHSDTPTSTAVGAMIVEFFRIG